MKQEAGQKGMGKDLRAGSVRSDIKMPIEIIWEIVRSIEMATRRTSDAYNYKYTHRSIYIQMVRYLHTYINIYINMSVFTYTQ